MLKLKFNDAHERAGRMDMTERAHSMYTMHFFEGSTYVEIFGECRCYYLFVRTPQINNIQKEEKSKFTVATKLELKSVPTYWILIMEPFTCFMVCN